MAWSAIGILILGYLAYRFVLIPVRIAFGPLLLALVIVYLLNPIVSRLEGRGLPRVWGTLLTYVVFLTVVGVALRLIIPIVADQVSSFVSTVPGLLDRAQRSLVGAAQRLGIEIRSTDILASLSPQGQAGSFITRIFSFTAGFVHALVVFVLGAVLGFYLLVDLPKVQRAVVALLPLRRRDEVRSVLEKMGRALGGYFRGQLLVAAFVGVASMLGLYIVGLPYWALVGAVAGLFNLIPLIGPFIGAVPALFIAFTTSDSGGLLHLPPGWRMALGAALALLVVQQIDNHIISPNVMARTVKLHPVTVMLGLLIGGTLAGLVGMLITVPVIASAKIVLLHLWDSRVQWPPGRSVREAAGSQLEPDDRAIAGSIEGGPSTR
ncbi:MAG TPA: AI-2E family transporter [Actinomycetota bacterium]|nr:AI-2E family transporter [Actinomycetota bacterium]